MLKNPSYGLVQKSDPVQQWPPRIAVGDVVIETG
jgi:hypothetical protein